jgi:ABC-type Fe3+/spermidine/putrescine transport system ATPase subunit
MARQDKPFVSFKGVQKSYDGETLVVKDLNLDIAAGEFLTMLGPSGSGKILSWQAGQSTIFRLTSAALVWYFRIMHCFRI